MNPSRVLAICAHPEPESFTAALLTAALEALELRGATLDRHDLYEEGFDPVLRREEARRRFSLDPLVQRHSAALSEAAMVVVAHPDWWGGPPAILKGWVDRVFRAELAYEVDEVAGTRPLLVGRSLLVLVPTDAEVESPAIAAFWSEAVAAFVGLSPVVVRVFCEVRRTRIRGRKAYLREAGSIAAELWDRLDRGRSRKADVPNQSGGDQ